MIMKRSNKYIFHGMIIIIIIGVLFLPRMVAAQTVPPSGTTGSASDYKIRLSPPIAILLICLISGFFLIGCISVYVRQCAESRMARSSPDNTNGGSGRRTRRFPGRGLDPTVIDSFPTFLYSDVKGLKISKTALECAVCLNEFEDFEILRLLPKCNHAFHPECIDAWLANNITCPVCRANLVLQKPEELGRFVWLRNDSIAESLNSSSAPQEADHSRSERDSSINDVEATAPEICIIRSRTPSQNRQAPSNSKRAGTNERQFRSHSTGHSPVQQGEDWERFTLRLPEEVRMMLMNSSKLSRTSSCSAFPRARSSKKGYRSSSVGTAIGRSNHLSYERFDHGNCEELPDLLGLTTTPHFISQTDSSSAAKEGVIPAAVDDLTAIPKSLFRSVKSPFDRLFNGSGAEKNDVGERSFDRLNPV